MTNNNKNFINNNEDLYFALNKLKNCSKTEIQDMISNGKLLLHKKYNPYFCMCQFYIFNDLKVNSIIYCLDSDELNTMGDADIIMRIVHEAVVRIEADNSKIAFSNKDKGDSKEDSNNNKNSLYDELYRRIYEDQCL